MHLGSQLCTKSLQVVGWLLTSLQDSARQVDGQLLHTSLGLVHFTGAKMEIFCLLNCDNEALKH